MKKWFKKTEPTNDKSSLELALPEEHKASIEIVAHKAAKEEAKAEVEQANALLQKIFKDNHFSLTIYLAAGGRVKQKPKGTH